MRTLYLCRHAKSSWAEAGQHDHDRPLNDRGLKDAPHMALRFKQRGDEVDMIVTSTAQRARSTADAYVEALHLRDEQYTQEPTLYHPTPAAINAVVNQLSNRFASVMLFGHNPGFSEAVQHFVGGPYMDMPTCSIARIDFMVDDWALVSRDMGQLIWFDYPKASDLI